MTTRYGLQRHFLGRNIDIIKHPAFKAANEMFQAVLVKLKSEGLGVAVHKNPITQEDMKKLYCSRYLSTDTPFGLQNKVFVDFMLYFANRGRENLRDMKKTDFISSYDADGKRFIMMKDKLTKNDRGADADRHKSPRMYEVEGSLICPVDSFNKYVSVLHKECELFWQKPKREPNVKIDCWYENMGLGKHTLGAKMKMLSSSAGLSRPYTNHCLRATCVTTLTELGFEARQIMAVTGHKSESSLRHYTTVGSPQKKRLSAALSTFISAVPVSESVDTVVDQRGTSVCEKTLQDIGLPTDLHEINFSSSQEAFINNSVKKSEINITNCVVNIYNN